MMFPKILSYDPKVLVKDNDKALYVQLKLNDWCPIREFFSRAAQLFFPGRDNVRVGQVMNAVADSEVGELNKCGCEGVKVSRSDISKQALEDSHVFDWDELV